MNVNWKAVIIEVVKAIVFALLGGTAAQTLL